VAWRGGQVSDRGGGVEGSTSGWGAGFAFEGAAGFRYDRATVPQASGLPRVKRKAWTFFVDPVRAVRVL
jgi:phage-related minor tail protein